MPELLFPFLGVVAFLTVTPGPDMLLVVRNGLSAGSRAAWLTGLGCCLGISIHATAAVLGLSAILAASATAYTVVKLAGVAYLAYLGIRMLISALMSVDGEEDTGATTGAPSIPMAAAATATLGDAEGTAAPAAPPADGARAASHTGAAVFRQGLITNLLNPKIALLFLTLLPQFVAHDEPRLRTTVVLAAIFLCVAVVWWRTFSLAIGPISRVLRGGRARRLLDGLAGSACSPSAPWSPSTATADLPPPPGAATALAVCRGAGDLWSICHRTTLTRVAIYCQVERPFRPVPLALRSLCPWSHSRCPSSDPLAIRLRGRGVPGRDGDALRRRPSRRRGRECLTDCPSARRATCAPRPVLPGRNIHTDEPFCS